MRSSSAATRSPPSTGCSPACARHRKGDWCWFAARRASERQSCCAVSATPRRACGSCGAGASHCERRVLWGRCGTSPMRPAASSRSGSSAGRSRTRSRWRCWASCAARPPTVLVLEDLHWADEATLDVMTLLAPRVGSAPALVLASYRDDELAAPEQLRFVLGELVRRPGRLKRRAAARRRRSPSSPRRMTSTPTSCTAGPAATRSSSSRRSRPAASGCPTRCATRSSPAPRGLPEPARRLLDAVAVVPGQVELWLLEALAGELADRVDECLAAGMLVAGPRARRVPPRAGAPGDRGGDRRRTAGWRCTATALAALAARGGDAGRRAARAPRRRGRRRRGRPALRRRAAAERAASSGAHREAAAQYARALRYADALAPGRAPSCSSGAPTSATRPPTSTPRSPPSATRSSAAGRSATGAARATPCARCRGCCSSPAAPTEAEPLALEAVALLEALPPGHELAMAYGNVSQRRMVVEDIEEAEAWGTRALELAERLGDTEARALRAHQHRRAAELQAERARGRRAARARAGARRSARPRGVRRPGVLTWSCARCATAGSTRPAAPLDAGLGVLRRARARDVAALPVRAGGRGSRSTLGRWDDAADRPPPSCAIRRSPPVARGWALAVLGLVRARRGDAGGRRAARGGARARAVDRRAHADRPGRRRPRRGGVADRRRRGRGAADRRGARARAAARTRRGTTGALAVLAPPGRPARRLEPAALAEPYRLALAGDAAGAADAGARSAARTRRRWRGGRRRPAAPRSTSCRRWARGRRPDRRPPAARARCPRRPARPAARTRENPAGLTARELEVLGLARRGTAQRPDRRAPGPLGEDRRPPRLGRAAQARRRLAQRGECGSPPAGDCCTTGSPRDPAALAASATATDASQSGPTAISPGTRPCARRGAPRAQPLAFV